MRKDISLSCYIDSFDRGISRIFFRVLVRYCYGTSILIINVRISALYVV